MQKNWVEYWLKLRALIQSQSKGLLDQKWGWIKSLSLRQVVLLLAVSGVVLYTAVSFLKGKPQQVASVHKPRVEIQELKAVETTNKLTLSGYTECVRRVMVRAEIPGKIKQVLKEKGSPVQSGEELVLIEESNYPALLEEARSRFIQKDLEYKSAVKLQAKAFKAENALAEAKADLATAKSALALCEKNMAATHINAPFEGVFEEKFVDVGAFVNVGDPIVEIMDLDPLRVICHVPEKNIECLTMGMHAAVQLSNVCTSPLVGHISYISKHAEAKTRTFQVELLIDNADLKISSGLTTEVVINVNSMRGHFISTALISLRDDGVLGIKIVEDGKVSFRPVNLANATPDGVWVTGLPETVSIITVGGEYVVEGQEVETVLKSKA